MPPCTARDTQHHAAPCTEAQEQPPGAVQACNEILPLKLHVAHQAAIVQAHTSHISAASSEDATRSPEHQERAGMVVRASSCSLAHGPRGDLERSIRTWYNFCRIQILTYYLGSTNLHRARAPAVPTKILRSGPGRQPGTSSREKGDTLLRDFTVATGKLY